jgi:hypothetical protein
MELVQALGPGERGLVIAMAGQAARREPAEHCLIAPADHQSPGSHRTRVLIVDGDHARQR